MSASDKKKLRNAQKAEQLTERQLAEQKEAKKLKLLTITMVAAIAVMLVFAIGVAAWNGIVVPMEKAKEAELHRNTVAATVGDHEVSAVQYNCFYVDAVSNFYNEVGAYAALYGLDVTKPLDEQTYSEEDETTWADYFKTSAESSMKSVYAIVDEAEANGFTLTEEDEKSIDSQMSYMALYAMQYGYSNVDDYLAAMYGSGANQETVRDYFTLCYIAQTYQDQIYDSLEYTDADIRAKDEKDPNAYSFYSYNSYYLASSKFLKGGTTGEDNTVTYSDEERAAAIAAAEEAAKTLTAENITSVTALDLAIAGLDINASATSAASTPYTDTTYSRIVTPIQEWVADESRQEGDLTYIPSTTTDADGKETVSGYYVVYFVGRNDNNVLLQNVRHLLVAFEGGTADENGNKTYSDEEKADAKEKAEALYEEWKSGDATEDSFAALANEKSDDGDGTTGGLYTDVYPGQMVTNFNDWTFDASRKAGDTGIVESEFGYHIMYYVGASEQTYRDMMIENTLRSEDVNAWHEALTEEVTVTQKTMDYVPTGMILNPTSTSADHDHEH